MTKEFPGAGPGIRLPQDFLKRVAILYPETAPSTRLVLVAILLIQPDQTPNISKLMEYSGLGRASVFRALRELEDVGLIERDRGKRVRKGDGWFKAPRKLTLDTFFAAWEAFDSPESEKHFSEMSLPEFQKFLGRQGATPEEAEHVFGILGTMPTHAEPEVPDEAGDAELQQADAALATMLPMQAPAPGVLSIDDLPASERRRLTESTMQQVIGLCYPLWADIEMLNFYEGLQHECYRHPAASHSEVWSRIATGMQRYLRARATDMGYDAAHEAERLTRSYTYYVDSLAYGGGQAMELDAFRERFYRHNEYREFA